MRMAWKNSAEGSAAAPRTDRSRAGAAVYVEEARVPACAIEQMEQSWRAESA